MPADCGARLTCRHEVKPSLLRFLRIGFQDLDHVTIVQLRTQGDMTPIHFSSNGLVAKIGMHGVRKIDDG